MADDDVVSPRWVSNYPDHAREVLTRYGEWPLHVAAHEVNLRLIEANSVYQTVERLVDAGSLLTKLLPDMKRRTMERTQRSSRPHWRDPEEAEFGAAPTSDWLCRYAPRHLEALWRADRSGHAG